MYIYTYILYISYRVFRYKYIRMRNKKMGKNKDYDQKEYVYVKKNMCM